MSIMNIVNGLLNRTNAVTQVEVVPQVEKPVAKEAVAHKGKWGYHPVSYETFLKLKDLHKWYFLTLHHLGNWVRWDRKTVHQHGPEPKYCMTFVVDKHELRKHVNKEGFTEYRWYPKTRVDRGVCEAYNVARMPKQTPEEVESLKISEEEINKLHAQVSAWFESNKS